MRKSAARWAPKFSKSIMRWDPKPRVKAEPVPQFTVHPLSGALLLASAAAVGAALILHLVSFVPVTMLGLVLMLRAGLSFRGAVDLASTVRDDEASGAAAAVPAAGVVEGEVSDLVDPSLGRDI